MDSNRFMDATGTSWCPQQEPHPKRTTAPKTRNLAAQPPGTLPRAPLQPLCDIKRTLKRDKTNIGAVRYLALSNSSSPSSNIGSLLYCSKNAFLLRSLSYWPTVWLNNWAMPVWLASIRPDTCGHTTQDIVNNTRVPRNIPWKIAPYSGCRYTGFF